MNDGAPPTHPDGAGWVLVFDGQCRFCRAGSSRLAKLMGGRVELVDYHQPGALARFPSLTPEACAAAMQLVDPQGRIYQGAEAAARAIASRGWLWRWSLIYYVPGLRWLADRLYAIIAANRYRIAGKVGDGCDSGTCRLPSHASSRR